MFLRVLSVAAAALALAGNLAGHAAAAPADAKAFFEKHRAYVGWQYGDIPALELTGTIERTNPKGGVAETVEMRELRRGMIYRRTTTQSSEGINGDSGFTGSLAWYADANGFTVPVYGDAATETLARVGLFSESLAQLNVTSLRKETLEGVPYDVARIALPSQAAIDLFEDAATGAFKRLVIDPDDKRLTIDVDAYAELLPGKRFVSAWHYHDFPTWTFRYASASSVASIEDGRLHPPAPSAHWKFGTGAIPVEESTRYNRFLIDATINGTRGHFVFDTGAAGISVTGPFAARAHLRHLGDAKAIGAIGQEHATIDRADQIAFDDGSVLTNPIVSTYAVNFSYKEHFDGFIGSGILTGTIATLDLDDHQLTLDDPATHVAVQTSGALAAFVDLSNGVPVVPVRINGSVPATALLDSGSRAHVLLDQSLLPKVAMLATTRKRFEGITGFEEADCGHLASILVGPIEYQNPHACFLVTGDSSRNSDAVLIGYDFLKNFNITFDYPAGQMFFVKRKD